MHYLFYGKDTFRISQKIKELKTRFLATDQSGINLEILEGEELTYGKFDQAVSTLPFLGSKRLAIIRNLMVQNKDNDLKSKIAQRLTKIDQNVVIIFSEEGEPDKRSKLFKTLNVANKSQCFDLFQGIRLENWIRDRAKMQRIKIDGSGVKKLALSLGSNLWRQDAEIKKLSLYFKAQGQSRIDTEKIDQLIVSQVEPNVFEFVDSLGRKNLEKVFTLLYQFYLEGENENYLFSMIIYQLRNLLKVSDLIQKGVKSRSIAKEAGLHPFVAKKTLSICNNFSHQKLLKIYNNLYQTDVNIKTGKIDAAVALDLCVAKISLM